MSPAIDAKLRTFAGQLVVGAVGTAAASTAAASTTAVNAGTIGFGSVATAFTTAKILTAVAGVGLLVASGTAGYVVVRSFERNTALVASSVGARVSETAPREVPRTKSRQANAPDVTEPTLAPQRKVPEKVPEVGQQSRASEGEPHLQDTSLLARETRMLEVARSALGSDPAQALEITKEHSKLFPKAQLRDERELIAVDALLRLGRRAEAWERAKSRILQEKESLYAKRMRQLFGSDTREE
jgi:hypothetical protein